MCVDDVPARRAFREQVLDEVEELRVGRHDGLLAPVLRLSGVGVCAMSELGV